MSNRVLGGLENIKIISSGRECSGLVKSRDHKFKGDHFSSY